MTQETKPNETKAPETAVAAPHEKTFLERATEALESAVETTVDAVKEHPAAAAAIAGGVAAAAAGAAFGISKLLEDDDKKA